MKKLLLSLIALFGVLNVQAGWDKTTTLTIGDVVVLAYDSESVAKELSEISTANTPIGKVEDFSVTPAGLYPLTVVAGNADNSYAFKNADGAYLSWASGNSLKLSETLDDASSWTAAYNNGKWDIYNVGTSTRKLQYNASSPRFACYGNSGQNPVDLWKQVSDGTVAKPTITVSTLGVYKSVKMIAEDGAIIYYTLDGTDPTTASSVYSEALNITTTTTVKAIAVKEEISSAVTESLVTIAEISTISEIIATGATDEAIASGTVFAVGNNGFLLGDNTGYIFTYTQSLPEVEVGDVVTVSGKVSIYGGCLQFSNASITKTGTTSVSYPNPTIIDGDGLDALAANPVVTYVKVSGTINVVNEKYNLIVEDAAATGSILAAADVMSDIAQGDNVTVTGYFVYQSSKGKYANIIPTEVKKEASLAEGELIPDYFGICEEGAIPYGYAVRFGDENRAYPDTYGSGPRMFKFEKGGDFEKAMYFREGYLQYGDTEKLTLEAGKKYIVYFNSAMWKSSGSQMTFSIFKEGDLENAVLTQTIDNAPDVNGSKEAVSGSTKSEIEFTPDADGNYILKWIADGWKEVLLANPGVKITSAASPEPTAALFADGKYYFKNVGSGLYWGASNGWGTQASLIKNPDYLTLINNDNGTYKIESQVSNGGTAYYFNGSYMDNENPLSLTIKKLANGYYTIDNGTTFYGYDGTTVLANLESGEVANAQWEIITQADMLASLTTATKEAPVDATFLIVDHTFGRNNRNVYAWTNNGGADLSGGNSNKHDAEKYHGEFNVYQKLTNAPAGVYKFTAQGFYRQDGSDEENLPVFYANDEEVTFPVKTGSENSMADACTSFEAGLYAADPIYVEVTEAGELTVGAKLEVNTNLWCIWDNFELTYYGAGFSIAEVRFASLITQLNELKAEATALKANEYITGAAVSEIDNAIAAAEVEMTTEEEYNTAISTMQNVINAAKQAIKDNKIVVTGIVPDNVLENWACTNDNKFQINTWSDEGASDGTNMLTPFFENWTSKPGPLGEGAITYTVPGSFEPGMTAQVSAFVRIYSESGAEPTGASFFVNNASVNITDIGESFEYNGMKGVYANIIVKGTIGEDGKLTFGVNISDPTFNWVAIKSVNFKVADETTITYENALATIKSGETYLIYTEVNGTKYYLNATGHLTDAAGAATFEINKVEGANETLYPTGWNLGVKFTNPSLSGGSTGDIVNDGHIHNGSNDRNNWERQVLFMNEEGKFAVRSTNANSANWGANTYWDVFTEAEMPEAGYSLEPSFVWHVAGHADASNLIALAEKLEAQIAATDTYDDPNGVGETIVAQIETIKNAFYTSKEEVNAAIENLTTLAKSFFNAITAKSSIDVTDWYIVNPAPMNKNGWEGTDFGTASDGVCEYWNKSGADFHQAIEIPAGMYRLTAVALQRTGMSGVIYAGEHSVEIAQASSAEANNRSQAAIWFAAGNGVNELTFETTEPGPITIGLTADNTTGDHWTVWKNFKLEMITELPSDVTYNLVYGENIIATETVTQLPGDEVKVPAAFTTAMHGLYALTPDAEVITKETSVINVTPTWTGPFEFSTDHDNAKWYNLNIRGGWQVSKCETEPYTMKNDATDEELASPEFQWAFFPVAGNPVKVIVVNQAAEGQSLTPVDLERRVAVLREGGYAWDIFANSDGFVLREVGTENGWVNQAGGGNANNPLAFWVDAAGKTDNGSTFRIQEVPVLDGSEIYAEIMLLVEQAQTLTDQHMDAEVKTALEEKITASDNLSDEMPYFDLKSFKITLLAAIENANNSISYYKTLLPYITEAEEIVAKLDKFAAAKEAVAAHLNDMTTAYNNGTATTEMVETWMGKATALARENMDWTSVDEGTDISFLIQNPHFKFGQYGPNESSTYYGTESSTPGWKVNSGAIKELRAATHNIEAWHQMFDFSQTLPNMPAGVYDLTLQGFVRHDNAEDTDKTYLYAGVSTRAIMQCTDQWNTEPIYYAGVEMLGDNHYDVEHQQTEGPSHWVDNGMTGSFYWFQTVNPNAVEQGGQEGDCYYTNHLKVVLAQDGNFTIGLHCDTNTDWVIWDNFQLKYLGNPASIYTESIYEKLNTLKDDIDASTMPTAATSQQLYYDMSEVADEAIASGKEENCLQAIEALDAAIATVQTTNAKAEELISKTNTISASVAAKHSSDRSVDVVIDEAYTYINKVKVFADVAAIQTLCDNLDASFAAFEAAEFNPDVITTLISELRTRQNEKVLNEELYQEIDAAVAQAQYLYDSMGAQIYAPQNGESYYIYCDNDEPQWYYNNDGTLAVSNSVNKNDDAYLWTCSYDGNYWTFGNKAGGYLGFKEISTSPESYIIGTEVGSQMVVRQGCVTMFAVNAQGVGKYLVMGSDGHFDQSSIAGYNKVTTDYSSDFVFVASNSLVVATNNSDANLKACIDSLTTLCTKADAYHASVEAQLEELPVGKDLTAVLMNPSYNLGETGWVANNMKQQGGATMGCVITSSYESDGVTLSTFAESWNGGGQPVQDASIRQTTRVELPEGTYALDADIITQSADDFVQNVFMFIEVTDEQTSETTMVKQSIRVNGGQPGHCQMVFNHTGGKLTFGVCYENTNATWVGMDNWKLSVSTAPDATDIAILTEAYEQMKGTKGEVLGWNLETNPTGLTGVTYTEGHVSAIDLAGYGLDGQFPAALLKLTKLTKLNLSSNALQGSLTESLAALAEAQQTSPLTSLNIANNSLKGNIGVIGTICPTLTSLNAENNKISDCTPALPATVTTLNLKNQTITDVWTVEWNQKGKMWGDMPTIMQYGGSKTLVDYGTDSNIFTRENGCEITVTTTEGPTQGSTSKAIFNFMPGDVDFSASVDVVDLQGSINYIFNAWDEADMFNYTAANLYSDEQINVQDIVKHVDVLLAQDETSNNVKEFRPMRTRTLNINDEEELDAEPEAFIFWRENELVLQSRKAVAAADIRVNSAEDINWTLPQMGFTVSKKQSAGRSHAIAYSLSGVEIPAGETVIATKRGGTADVEAATLSDRKAKRIRTDIKKPLPTGIDELAAAEGGWMLVATDGTVIAKGEGVNAWRSARRRLATGVYILTNAQNKTQKVTIK